MRGHWGSLKCVWGGSVLKTILIKWWFGEIYKICITNCKISTRSPHFSCLSRQFCIQGLWTSCLWRTFSRRQDQSAGSVNKRSEAFEQHYAGCHWRFSNLDSCRTNLVRILEQSRTIRAHLGPRNANESQCWLELRTTSHSERRSPVFSSVLQRSPASAEAREFPVKFSERERNFHRWKNHAKLLTNLKSALDIWWPWR